MIAVMGHIAMGGGMVLWAATGVDPLIVMASYAFGILLIKGPPRAAG